MKLRALKLLAEGVEGVRGRGNNVPTCFARDACPGVSQLFGYRRGLFDPYGALPEVKHENSQLDYIMFVWWLT